MLEWLSNISSDVPIAVVIVAVLVMVLRVVLVDMLKAIRINTAVVLSLQQQVVMIMPSIIGITSDSDSEKVSKMENHLLQVVRSIEEIKQSVMTSPARGGPVTRAMNALLSIPS